MGELDRYVVVVHKLGRFSLNRNYELNVGDDNPPIADYVSIWTGWCCSATTLPEWTEGLDKDDFTAYWAY
jgi:hypothetical protein